MKAYMLEREKEMRYFEKDMRSMSSRRDCPKAKASFDYPSSFEEDMEDTQEPSLVKEEYDDPDDDTFHLEDYHKKSMHLESLEEYTQEEDDTSTEYIPVEDEEEHTFGTGKRGTLFRKDLLERTKRQPSHMQVA